MTRSVLCSLAVLLAAGWSAGQPPKDDPPGKKDPAPPPNRFPGAARAAQEEVELLEAQLATKEAYVKAAEVAVDGPKVRLARLAKLAQAGTVTEDEVEAVKVEVRLAEAQVAIRRAEANEVAVKLEHARGRVERAGKRAAAEPDLKRAEEAAEAARAASARTREAARAARQQYDRLRAAYEPGTPALVKAEEGVKEALAVVKAADARAAEATAEVDRLLKQIGGTDR